MAGSNKPLPGWHLPPPAARLIPSTRRPAMREDTWRGGKYPGKMLDHVGDTAGTRRLRLCACGLARLLWDEMPSAARAAVEAAEAYADDPGAFVAMREARDRYERTVPGADFRVARSCTHAQGKTAA